MKSDNSILMALMDEMESLSRAARPNRGGRIVGAIAAVVLAALGAGAAWFLLDRKRRRKLQKKVDSVSKTSVRRVKARLADAGFLPRRRSSNGSVRSRRTAVARAR